MKFTLTQWNIIRTALEAMKRDDEAIARRMRKDILEEAEDDWYTSAKTEDLHALEDRIATIGAMLQRLDNEAI